MALTDFQEEVLGWLHDDLESPKSLAGDLSREFAQRVTERDVFRVLVDLTARGYAAAYRFDGPSNQFVEVNTFDPTSTDFWFKSTPAGRAVSEDADG